MKKWILRIGILALGLIGLVVIGAVIVSGIGRSRFSRIVDIDPQLLEIPTDDEALARGEHLVTAVAHCGYCHGPELGGNFIENNPRAEGVIVAPNLTAGEGGLGAAYSTEDWIRAIRHGVTQEGRSVLIMPSLFFADLGQEDLAAMIAYLQTIPAVDNVLPQTEPGPLFFALLGAGPLVEALSAVHIDHEASYAAAPAEGPTAEYGAYLARIGQCTACHGAELAGGQVNRDAPIGPNLTPGGELGAWTEEQFHTLIRTGSEPDGQQINPYMPWHYFRNMTGTELSAIWAYLQSQPALEDRLP